MFIYDEEVKAKALSDLICDIDYDIWKSIVWPEDEDPEWAYEDGEEHQAFFVLLYEYESHCMKYQVEKLRPYLTSTEEDKHNA